MIRLAASLLVGLQQSHPRLFSMSHWLNIPATLGNIILNHDVLLQVLAFAFVTVPLGILQWWNLADKWKARRAKHDKPE